MAPGFYLNGLFLGIEHVEGVDRNTGERYERDYVGVACGTEAYRVYLSPGQGESFVGIAVGDPVIVGLRPSVSQRGTLSLGRGYLYKK